MSNDSDFSMLKYNVQKILINYENINQKLIENNFKTLSDGGNPINDFIKKGELPIDVSQNYQDIANYAYELSKIIEKDFDQTELKHIQQLRHERDRNLEIRKNFWKLWIEKYIRWVIGLAIAIFLYSAFTYHTDESKFWKIPVKSTIEKFVPH